MNSHIFLEGPAGCGKTTVGIERLVYLLKNGVPGSQILVLVPQRTLATPYMDILRSPDIPAGSVVSTLTIGGLARRMVALFWPIISEQAGFAHPLDLPTFLTLESAQYYMAHLVRPLLEEGYFDSLTIDRNRLYSQLLDNLNKSASVGFSHTEIGARLKAAWIGESSQVRVYDDAQHCASLFREFCLANNMLDFSLQLEVLRQFLWSEPSFYQYRIENFSHLIFDNLEEDIPLVADILQDWLPDFDSSLLIFDQDGGFRQFLSADPITNYTLKNRCEVHTQLSQNFITTEGIGLFGSTLSNFLQPQDEHSPITNQKSTISNLPIDHTPLEIRFFPEMLDWVADQVARLIDSGFPPGEIVILAPYLSDSLRYSLVTRLDQHGVPSRSHRPSRALRDEPATLCLLTLVSLAYPKWGYSPQNFDVAYALLQAIEGLDLIRSQLLVNRVYRNGVLNSFDTIQSEFQERITYVLGARFEILRNWLSESADNGQQLDHFVSRLFGEVLSQPGFGFHADYNAAAITANIVESVRKFRWAVGDYLSAQGIDLGAEYLQMVREGVIAAQYLGSWTDPSDDAVYLAPAYTYLMSNRPVRVQFWLDIGGRGWYERLYQPLTQPYVLSRHRIDGSPWTDSDEFAANQASLRRLVLGLTRRCSEFIYLGISGINEQGYEHKGQLLRAVDQTLRFLT